MWVTEMKSVKCIFDSKVKAMSVNSGRWSVQLLVRGQKSNTLLAGGQKQVKVQENMHII